MQLKWFHLGQALLVGDIAYHQPAMGHVIWETMGETVEDAPPHRPYFKVLK